MNEGTHRPPECKWTVCGHPEDPVPCPYMKPDADEFNMQNRDFEFVETPNTSTRSKPKPEPLNACAHSPHGRHEWRCRVYYYADSSTPIEPAYYCIFCTTTKP